MSKQLWPPTQAMLFWNSVSCLEFFASPVNLSFTSDEGGRKCMHFCSYVGFTLKVPWGTYQNKRVWHVMAASPFLCLIQIWTWNFYFHHFLVFNVASLFFFHSVTSNNMSRGEDLNIGVFALLTHLFSYAVAHLSMGPCELTKFKWCLSKLCKVVEHCSRCNFMLSTWLVEEILELNSMLPFFLRHEESSISYFNLTDGILASATRKTDGWGVFIQTFHLSTFMI